MKERPIIYSSAMVRAKGPGLKTMTRRIVKFPKFINGDREQLEAVEAMNRYKTGGIAEFGPCDGVKNRWRCPYGKPGDRLWTKETFYAWGRWETRFNAEKGRDAWHFVDMTRDCGKEYRYHADTGDNVPLIIRCGEVRWWKRPAIFMPRHASRYTDEITDIRIERLLDISEADARAEGASFHDGLGVGHSGWRHDFGAVHANARSSFARLWESINVGTWDANPFVWVVEFQRIAP